MNEELVFFTPTTKIETQRYKELMCSEKMCEQRSTHHVIALIADGNGMGFYLPLCDAHTEEFNADRKQRQTAREVV